MPSMAQVQASDNKWDFDRVFRLLLSVAAVVGLFALVRYLADVLIPFAVALLFAFLLNPIVDALQSRLHRRGAAVFVTVLGCGVVAFAVMLLLAYVGGREVASLRDLVQDLVRAPTAEDVRHVGRAFDEFVERQTNPTIKGILTEARENIAQNKERYLAQLEPVALAKRALRLIAPSLVGLVTGVLSFVLGLTVVVVVLLYLVFLLIDYPRIAQTWRGFLPPKYREDIIGFLDEFRVAMSRYFRGQFIIAMIVGVLFAIGFSLLGLRMAVLLGLGIGLLNMVPYLQTVGLIPALLLGVVRGLESGGALWVSALLVLGVFAVVQTIQDAVLAPTIMGRSVGLRPVVLLLGIFIWGKLLGFLGLVLAIPLTCLGLAYYKRFVLGDRTARATAGQ